MPDWLANFLGADATAWLEYFTNGKHLAWYGSFGFTIAAAVFGGLLALIFGLGSAALRRSHFGVTRVAAAGYINIVRGVPDVLFFLFFPLAFEQAVEWLAATQVCSASELAAQAARWPPCAESWRGCRTA